MYYNNIKIIHVAFLLLLLLLVVVVVVVVLIVVPIVEVVVIYYLFRNFFCICGTVRQVQKKQQYSHSQT